MLCFVLNIYTDSASENVIRKALECNLSSFVISTESKCTAVLSGALKYASEVEAAIKGIHKQLPEGTIIAYQVFKEVKLPPLMGADSYFVELIDKGVIGADAFTDDFVNRWIEV